MNTHGRQLLAQISDEAAQVWRAFAEVNDVTVDSLLDALGPILLSDSPSEVSFASALTDAVETARRAERDRQPTS